MLKTTESSVASTSRVNDDEVIGDRGAVVQSDALRNLAKAKNRTKSDNNSGEPMFLTSKAKEALNCLRQAFTKALILRHFDPERHIWIETNASGYAIRGVLSQLTRN